MLSAKAYGKLGDILGADPAVEAFSPRIRFGAMLSNYAQTTNVRLNGVDPAKEEAAAPLLAERIKDRTRTDAILAPGEVVLPEILAKGMALKAGDTVVLVANNKDGSVNGMTFIVAGMVESLMGPGGRDGYLHIDDARALLRMTETEISEVAVRIKDPQDVDMVAGRLQETLAPMKNQAGQPMFEVHSWKQLSPFFNVVRMIDLMTLGVQTILIAVVLISVLNVMMMSVYERVREIGTLAAMGTRPGRIMGLFVAEGFSLGLVSALGGAIIGTGALWILNFSGVEVAFGGAGQVFTLAPAVSVGQVVSAALIVVGISVLASLQPAAKASRLAPVDALRHI
jgi:putative ABC transport system permease protein